MEINDSDLHKEIIMLEHRELDLWNKLVKSHNAIDLGRNTIQNICKQQNIIIAESIPLYNNKGNTEFIEVLLNTTNNDGNWELKQFLVAYKDYVFSCDYIAETHKLIENLKKLFALQERIEELYKM
jgi:hypothetical protein